MSEIIKLEAHLVATVAGYVEVWENHLKEHFTGRTFRAYEPHHGNKLLNEKVAQGYGRRMMEAHAVR